MLGAWGLLGACSSDIVVAALDAGSDGGGDGGEGGASNDAAPDGLSNDGAADARADAREAGPVTGTGYLRIANLSADAPNFDVCLSAAGTTDFTNSKPLVRTAGTLSGVGFGQATTFAPLDPGMYGLRYIAAGTIDCGVHLGTTKDDSIAVASQEFATGAVTGVYGADAGATPFGVHKLVDDAITSALGDGGGGSSLRVVHEAVGTGAIELGTGTLTDGDYVQLFPSLTYGKTSPAAGAIDALGYRFPIFVNGTTLSVHLTAATTDLRAWQNLVLGDQDVATLFLVRGPTAQQTIAAVLCARDYAPAAAAPGINPTCAIVP